MKSLKLMSYSRKIECKNMNVITYFDIDCSSVNSLSLEKKKLNKVMPDICGSWDTQVSNCSLSVQTKRSFKKKKVMESSELRQ